MSQAALLIRSYKRIWNAQVYGCTQHVWLKAIAVLPWLRSHRRLL